jgi:uncharacterized protein YndB with AHSA1/START domain
VRPAASESKRGARSPGRRSGAVTPSTARDASPRFSAAFIPDVGVQPRSCGARDAEGVYREIVRPERLVNTEKFDVAWYPGEGLSTLLLLEKGGQTMLTNTVLYESKEARDGVLKSGMERGVAASYDRLAELLSSQKA